MTGDEDREDDDEYREDDDEMIRFLSLMLPVFLLGICLVNALSMKRHL